MKSPLIHFVSSASFPDGPEKLASVLIGCQALGCQRLMASAPVLAYVAANYTMLRKCSFGDEARYFRAYRCPPMRLREGICGKSMEAFVDPGKVTSRREPAVQRTSRCLRPRA